MVISINRITKVARSDFSRRLGYAESLFRDSLEDQMESIKIRNKTVADFDFYTLANTGFSASATIPLMQYEMIRSGLDFIAIVEDKKNITIQQGAPPSESMNKLIPAICYSPLTVNIFVIGNEPWIVSAAMITKLRHQSTKHVIFAQRIPRDFADKLKRLTGANFSLIYAGKRVLTTLMNQYGKREINSTPLNLDENEGTVKILGKSHSFVRSEALHGKISDTIRLEILLPDSDYILLAKIIQRDFVLFGILGIILAIITGSFLSYHIATPINSLAMATTQIADGEMSIDLDYDRKDEIGVLYSNFNNMVSSLFKEQQLKESRMKELNTLFEISNAVNIFATSDDLLKFVLNHSIEVLGAERGSIMLMDDNTDELKVTVASGGKYRIILGNPIKLGSGICGNVALTGEGVICNDGFKNPTFKDFGSLLPVEDISTLICSPLKFKEGTIGVINIVNKRNNKTFEESDLSLLNLIASQAAVTIENNKLYELSITDGLTKLYVHRYFKARISEELLRARRYGLTLSLIMMDIDDFKSFNDTYGHQIGDKVLQEVANTIKRTVRTGIDIPCRYGGEEMSVILPETRSEEAFQMAERLRINISEIIIRHDEKDLKITVSIGISSFPNDSHNADSLICEADKAMYVSKGHGKNRSTSASYINAT